MWNRELVILRRGGTPDVRIDRCLAGRRPARLHCEKSGESDGNGASARSGCAQTAKILRARSASVVAVTRCFSPCLIFSYFWIKPKVQKEADRFRPITLEVSRSEFLNFLQESPYHLLVPKGGAKTIRRAKKSGKRRHRRLKRYADKLAPALLNGASADVSIYRFFAMRSLRCAARDVISVWIFNKLQVCTIVLRTKRKSGRFPRSISFRSE